MELSPIFYRLVIPHGQDGQEEWSQCPITCNVHDAYECCIKIDKNKYTYVITEVSNKWLNDGTEKTTGLKVSFRRQKHEMTNSPIKHCNSAIRQ